jgi:hypothetical protein
MPYIRSVRSQARLRARYLRHYAAQRGRPGYRGQQYAMRQWPFIYRGLYRSAGLRRRYGLNWNRTVPFRRRYLR